MIPGDADVQHPSSKSWPLWALRYGIFGGGLLAWLWEIEQAENVIAGALLFSFMLLLELPLESSRKPFIRGVAEAAQMLCGLGALLIAPGPATVLILSVILCGLAVRGSRFLVIGCGLAVLTTVYSVHTPVSQLVAAAGTLMLAATAGWQFRRRRQEDAAHQATVAALEEAQERIAQYAETTRDLAAAHERQRVTEALHDTLGHALVGTLLQVQIAQRLITADPPGALERLSRVEKSLRETLESVRRALRSDPERRGVLPLHLALESLIADFRTAGGPEVELTLRPDAESVAAVSPEVGEVIYRTVQEALTNAVRHGEATRIRIEAEAVGPRLYLRITDNGVGVESITPGMGLTGMVRRVQAVGGALRFQSAEGKGFQVEVGVKRQ